MELTSETCEKCKDMCCYYKEDEKENSPIFSKEDVEKIEKRLGKSGFFKPINKSKIVFRLNLAKSKNPLFYRCPFFDENTKKCTIYDLRPLDCDLFPFTFVKRDGQVYLGIVDETVCAFMKKLTKEDIQKSKLKIIEKIKREKILETLKKYPDLILDYDNVDLLEKIDLNKA